MSNAVEQKLATESVPAEPISRRTFAKVLFTGVGLCYAGAIGYPIYQYLASPIQKSAEAAKVSEVHLPEAHKLEPGSAVMFKFGTRPGILIHHKDGSWTAMEAVCTHMACTVQYQPDTNRLFCACHGGVYDVKTGAAVAGPPPKPLKTYKVEVSENGVTISKA
ncbi:MAG: Rieske (2Fe-2S) protein [Chloroherpetonaceae bacterium]|nr:Rieske (2Fe-2S) protein [Chloroherpetonaceae bacterium]